jgi:membrane carboxypeptidase/penicillin-binding protein
MWEEGYITETELEDIADRELQYQRADYVIGEAPYFIAMVRDYVSEKYGERVVYQGGLKIYTTLDLDMQKAANKAYQAGMKEREADVQAALVALDVSNGDIRALIGGRDFALSNYNRVFSERQPGSTFKPFLYSLAMEWGMTQAEQIKCEEVEFKLPTGDTYTPEDYGDDKYHWKEFTLKEALMISDNVIAVRLNHLLGPQYVANHAEKFGFKNIEPILSLPLGSKEVTPLDMAAAYSVFANGGIYSQPRYILKVVDRYGQVLEESDSQQRQVVSPENAYIISDMLKGVLEAGGTGSHLKAQVGRPAAGKTGTTDDYNDAWFVGYTPQLCCAVWVGYDQGRNVNLVGGVGAGPIWANFIREASANLAPRDFIKPDDIILLNVCLDSGQVAVESCPRSKRMAFIEGSEPREICYYHTSSLDWLLDAVMP